MIVRTFNMSDSVNLFKTSISRHIVTAGDEVGHLLFDSTIEAGTSDTIADEYVALYSGQAHYCLEGRGTARLGGAIHSIGPGTLIAASLPNSVEITAETDMRVCTILGNDSLPGQAVVRSLHEIVGTERDVFWGNGQSRRLLIRKDGLGFALCITFGNANTDSPLQYRNHFESCYYVSGSGEYVWDTNRHPIDTGEGTSTVFIMNRNDAHRMVVKDESICLSIFSPPIEGHESHNMSAGSSSSY